MRSAGNRNGHSPEGKITASYAVTGGKGNYPTVRSELMFLLHKNPNHPAGVIRNSLPLVGFLKYQKRYEHMTATTENKTITKVRTSGRPKKTIKRSDFLMVRLTPTERILIEGRAKNAGLKPSEWFRRAAKNAKVFPRFTVEETGWFRMLAGIANNLNQLTHLAHVAGLFTLAMKCQTILKQVEELITKLSSHDG